MLSSPKEETYKHNGKGEIEPSVAEQPIPQKPKTHRFKRFLLGLLATGLLTVPFAVYLAQNRAQLKPEMIETLTVPVKTQDLTVRITASGVVQPVRRVNLSPKTQGRLSELFVEQGDYVEAGQVIARMESREIEAQVLQAEAGLARVRANLNKLQTGSRPEAITTAQAQLDRVLANLAELEAGTRPEEVAVAQAKLNEAEARLADARSGSLDDEIAQAESRLTASQADLELASERVRRYQSLRNQGAVSEDSLEEYLQNERRLSAVVNEAKRRIEQLKQSQRSQVDRLEATVEQERQALRQLKNGARVEDIAAATAEVAEVRSNLNELINGTRPEEIAAAQAEVREAQAQVRYYQTQLEDANVRAPFSGVIAQRYAVEGAFVTPATSASDATSATSASIVALAKDLEVLAKIPETDIGRIQPNQKVEIIADSYPDQVFEGRVQLIAPEAVKERDVTLFQARVEIITGKDLLQSGMNVDLKFIGDKLNNALVVPTVAIVTNKGETGVLLPDEQNQPRFHPVTIGSTIGNQIQILEGIEAGDRVFIELPEGKKLEDIIK
ncbi:efflux RND transporter periplasmic adaptor subunit [Lyngbya sp. PCC 8106]|uniref:efflux RND transporter periplasmic adaptor subunit n=1 Tax=Lyngbya sp. (strain PCC 8106) TaxID=313612 RepID=UPI0000EAD902|nr:efflux RND transporter periplasmic adaptor subunit [Lyngbya sp. PCC 8106]EAW34929.1 hypothetical protein L8106_04074 [Lyngbya sp. PCC 8106]